MTVACLQFLSEMAVTSWSTTYHRHALGAELPFELDVAFGALNPRDEAVVALSNGYRLPKKKIYNVASGTSLAPAGFEMPMLIFLLGMNL